MRIVGKPLQKMENLNVYHSCGIHEIPEIPLLLKTSGNPRRLLLRYCPSRLMLFPLNPLDL